MKPLLVLLLSFSLSAFAGEGNGSEYQWQTPAGKWEATPGLTYKSETFAPKGGGTDKSIKGTILNVRGEYGIDEMFSAGLYLAVDSLKTESSSPSTKSSGLEDLVVSMLGRSSMSTGTLRYGADLGLALQKQKFESNGDSNASSGGISIRPFVGYEINAAPCIYGARLSYKMGLGDRTITDQPATEAKGSGGETTTLALFYEHDMAPMKVGAALEIEGNANSKLKVANTTTTIAGNTSTGLRIYAPYSINEMVTVLPDLKYQTFTALDKEAYDSGSGFDLNVAARLNF